MGADQIPTDLTEVFFDVWRRSYNEKGPPLWVEPSPPSLYKHCRLSQVGLIQPGSVEGQDDYVWKLTPLGCLVGAANFKKRQKGPRL